MDKTLDVLIERYGENATLRDVLAAEQRRGTSRLTYHQVLARLTRRDPNAVVGEAAGG